ncbi:MAG: hypothetical protein AB7C91_01360 [Sphaerochaeta sp.]|uniref:hypothetical protein n=1 Tax=Sphaerochaeta sp. TaxID=1972642 RepID=UPI002FC5BCDC
MKKITTFVGMLVLTALLFGNGVSEGNTQFTDPTNAQYLDQYFSVTLPSTVVDRSTFAASLSKISGKQIVLNQDADLFKALVQASDLNELALTYSNEKALNRLQQYGIFTALPSDVSRYLACALDAHLLPASVAMQLLSTGTLDSKTADNLLMSVANANGEARNYIGKVSDADILMRISNAFDGYTLFSDGNLDKIGAATVQKRASTGYNLKKDADAARFLSSRTIQYGHSDEVHLKQLIVLLNSEGIDAKIQIEPKVSIYEYLLDWGPVPEPSPYYMVLEFSDNFYLAYAVEYDAKFEFNSKEDLLRFDSLINTYAKKNDTNQAKGSNIPLLKGSWWQPLYSTTFNADPKAYVEIVDCVLEDNGYSIHPFSLLENKANLINTLESLSGLSVHEHTLFVNNAFHRYLTGADYQ